MIVGGTGLEAGNQKFYLGFTAFEMPGRSPVKDVRQANEHVNLRFSVEVFSSKYTFGSHQHDWYCM